MSFNVSALSVWVKNNNSQFVGRLFQDATSIRVLLDGQNAQLGNKPGKSKMVYANVGVNLNTSACDRGVGNTPMLDKELETFGLMDNEFYCSKDLYKTYASWALRAGMSPEGEFSIEFLDWLVDQKLSALNRANEKLVWLGDTTSADGNVNKFNGFVKQIRASSGYTTLSSIATDTVTRLQDMYAQMPTEVVSQPDFRIFIGADEYNKYVIGVSNKNLFDPANPSLLFGTNGMIVPTQGLNGTGIVIMGSLSDLIVSTDLASDLDTVDVNYSVEKRGTYLDIDYALGVTIGRPENIGITAPVGVAPAITTQPANATKTVGSTHTFSVVATGATGYQWQSDTVGAGFTNISGANGASYTTGVLGLADNTDKYRVIVSNGVGSTTSATATLTVA